MRRQTPAGEVPKLLQCYYCNWGYLDKVDQSDCRKIIMHSEKVSWHFSSRTVSHFHWIPLNWPRVRQKSSNSKQLYSSEQNGVFCDCFASLKLAKTFILKLKCSAFIRSTSFTGNWKGRLKNWVFVFKCPDTGTVRILGNILYKVYL